MKTDTKTLRTFGFVMGAAFLVFGAALYVFGEEGVAAEILLSVAVLFAVSALFAPAVLRPVEYVWMKLAHVLGYIMTMLILAVLFFVVITPMSIAARFFGKQFLDIQRQEPAESYWRYRKEDQDKHRAYEVQF